jgi:hypothetical protein
MPQTDAAGVHVWNGVHRTPAMGCVGHDESDLLILIQIIADGPKIFFVGIDW